MQKDQSNPDPSPLGSLSKRDFLRLAPLGLLVGMTGTASAAHKSSSPFPDGAWGVETIVGHGTSERPSIAELEAAWSETYHFLFVDVDSGDRYYAEHGDNEWTALSSGGLSTIVIDDTDSPYVTQDEDIIYINDANGAVTVTLASADATAGNEIELVLLDGSNGATVNTEGSETIEPGSVSSKNITQAGWNQSFTSDGTDWRTGVTLQETGLAFPDSATTADGATAIGENATASQQFSSSDPGTAVGGNATANSGLAIGDNTSTERTNAIAIGAGADTAKRNDITVVGANPDIGGRRASSLGANLRVRSDDSVAIGENADAAGAEQVVVGADTDATFADFGSIAIGYGATAGGGTDTIAIGRNVSTTTEDVSRIGGSQLVFGAIEDGQIADADLNNNEITFDLFDSNDDGTINQVIVRVKDATGTIRIGSITVN